jgi:hypothetical protein
MQVFVLFFFYIVMLSSCSRHNESPAEIYEALWPKAYFNSDWQKEDLAQEEWYYRASVVDAAANTSALGLGEGHWLEPESIRFEITKDYLIAWRSHSSMINAEKKGAPVLAFRILSHVDNDDEKKSALRPWQEQAYIRVDWSKNLISELGRHDSDEGISSAALWHASFMADDGSVANPKRLRRSSEHFDFVTRHPLEPSADAQNGKFGRIYASDSANLLVDLRHSFIRKKESDYVPVPMPDFVRFSTKNGEEERIPINERFGFFRTNMNGRPVFNPKIGSSGGLALVNGTLFNIWEKSRDAVGNPIPMELRQPKPIIYYTKLFYPQDLLAITKELASEWDYALRNAVFHAKKLKKREEVPRMFIVRENSCNFANVSYWLTTKVPEQKNIIEREANVTLLEISKKLASSDQISDFTVHHEAKMAALGELERICAALEHFSENKAEPFVYQRPGDLRFNMINLEVKNNVTSWAGYGPMLSDSLTGETISANAHVNMKYIDLKAAQLARQIALIKDDKVALQALAGSHSYAPKLAQELNRKSLYLSSEENYIVDKLTEKKKTKEKNLNKHEIMDHISFIDDIAVAIALKFADLPEDQRFKRIREMVFKAVLLHELGHNLGLKHNMAGSADALNYGQKFWWIESLPSSIKAASLVVKDHNIKKELLSCLDTYQEIKAKTKHNLAEPSTKDCLMQKSGMYSSIMDYHASTFADLEGLGHYDIAAIAWGYGNVIETFPKNKIMIDTEKLALSRWLYLNDYRHIPKALLKNTAAIEERNYESFAWGSRSAKMPFPKNAVPYLYCDDASGRKGPHCLAFDFGPDMTSSALWLRSRFLDNYLFNHFAHDESWQGQNQFAPLMKEIDSMERFSAMLRWYERAKEDKDFKGSYLESDYRRALKIALQHFVHVLALPEAGPHLSMPRWKNANNDKDRLQPSRVLMPINQMSECELRGLTASDELGNVYGRNSYLYTQVPLGSGRPYDNRMIRENEDVYMLYSGTSLLKKFAIHYLLAPSIMSTHPRFAEFKNINGMSFYRLYPEAVAKVLNSVINQDHHALGPIINKNGEISWPDVIDEDGMSLSREEDVDVLMPALDDSLSLFALETAAHFIPQSIGDEPDISQAMRINCTNCPDNFKRGELLDGGEIVRFSNFSGFHYEAAKMHNMENIAARMLERAKEEKALVERLQECVNNEEKRQSDPVCACIKTVHRKAFNDWQCCEPENSDCPAPEMLAVGADCSLQDLSLRQEEAYERLNKTLGFIDEARRLLEEAHRLP